MAEEKKKSKIRKFFRPSVIIWILILIFAIVAAFSSFYIVDETENAVVTRFGKYTETVGSGLHWKLPFGIDKAYTVPVKVVQTEQFGFKSVQNGKAYEYKNNIGAESTMLTGDLNIVDVEWIIQYRIVDPKKWLFEVYEKEDTIRDISRSVINTLVGDRAILAIMGSERTAIETQALDMMNETFDSLGLGIKVIAVKLQNIVPPSGVQDAFEDVNKATQDMNTFINEGKEAYNKEIPKAKGEANRQIQIAEGYAAERVNRAEGDVARFNAIYEEYKKNPTITKERMYYETLDEVFGGNVKPDLIDSELENVLPLKNLKAGN